MAYFNNDNRRDDRRNFGGRRDRKMYPAVCAQCGQDCQVPFFPDGSKPVYCSNCFEQQQGGRGRDDYDARRPRRSFGGNKSGGQDMNKELLVSINSKLGKILELLSKNNQSESVESAIEIDQPVTRKPAKKAKAKKKEKKAKKE